MIFDVPKRSLLSGSVLLPIEDLLGSSRGSRMPGVEPARLTAALAQRAMDACPTQALAIESRGQRRFLRLDYAECIGCGRCEEAGDGAFVPTDRLTCCGASKGELIRRWDLDHPAGWFAEAESRIAQTGQDILALFGRAVNIREVDAGSCSGCEGEIVALTNPYYDLERFGIHFVASPKHADMLLVTGQVTRNMAEAVKRTYEAVPTPKLVVAVGACGCSGGLFGEGTYAAVGGVDRVVPVDVYLPGCPPRPQAILHGLLVAMGLREARIGSPP
jgi:Ni,Fe-hydrogenase III small subunit/ferredoxin